MRRTALFILIFSLLGATGCTGVLSKKQQEVNAMGNEVELTQEKKDFLTAMSMDEERVQAGKLYDWQTEVLRQYDYAMDYLEKKYPSHSFKFTACNPKGRDSSFSTFWFEADGGENSYELYLDVDNDGNYSCEDNYYGELLKDSYNIALLSLLQENIPECIGAASEFNTVQGAGFGEKITGKDVLEGKDKVSNTTYIYAVQSDDSQAQSTAEKIENFIKDRKIYGSYYVEILNSDPGAAYDGDKLKVYAQEAGNQNVILEQKFNQFD